MRLLTLALLAEPRVLGTVKKSEMHAWAFGAEPIEEVVRVGRCTVCGSPERYSGRERHGLERRFAEDVHIGAPVDEGVEAVRPVPVVVARREVDRDRIETCKRLTQELGCVAPGAFMFVEIAATEESVSPFAPRHVHDPQQGVSQRLTPPPPGVTRRAGPSERGVQVEIRKVN